MKKIKSILIKIKAKATLKTYQKPLLVTIISLLIINLIILLIGSIVMLNVDDSGYFEGKFISAFATCMKCMISANSINTLIKDLKNYIVKKITLLMSY